MMSLPTAALLLVALLHAGFFLLESVFWMSPPVMRIFEQEAEAAEATRVLAFNQGFYNLGAAALLLWLHATANYSAAQAVLVFLVVMGLVGAVTANWRILLLQSLPAAGALLLLW